MKNTILALAMSGALSGCASMTPEDRDQWDKVFTGLAVGLAVGVGAYAAGSNSAQSSRQDYAWDWDQQSDGYGGRVWTCRGLQTGRYSEHWRCTGLIKTDWRWPN